MIDEIREMFFTPLSYSKRAGCHVGESVLHYESEGWRLGLNPHPLFDTNYFMNKYADGSTKVSPFQIYDRVRKSGFPLTTAFFQMGYYLSNNQDIANACVSPVEHYVSFGITEGRQPNPWYLLDRPSLPATEFWEEVGTLDKYLSELDTLRSVDVAWIAEAMNVSISTAHSTFWHNRYENLGCWPMNPERVLGSINPQNFKHLDQFSAALELLIAGPSEFVQS